MKRPMRFLTSLLLAAFAGCAKHESAPLIVRPVQLTQVTHAKAEFERFQSRFAQNFVSKSALDQKQNGLNANAAKYDQAKAQLAVARNQSA